MINTALAILQTDEQRNTLSDFYQTYKNRFYAIAYSKLHDRNLAEDAVQEDKVKIRKHEKAALSRFSVYAIILGKFGGRAVRRYAGALA